MSSEPLRVGMIGVGHFGAARRNTLRATGLFQIVAAYDRNPAALESAERQDGAKPCGSLDELLATDGLEAMVISTGADSHAKLSIAAMKAGLHVFVEKPLCTSVEEVNALVEAQQESGVVVGVGHGHHEGDPAIRSVNQLKADGSLGKIACYEENSSHSGGLIIKPGDWRGLKERNPGGMLFQCGVHSLHRLNHLFGPVESLQAMFRYDVHDGTETADVASVLLRHTSGVTGTLNCYHVSAYRHELMVFGTNGTLNVNTLEKGGEKFSSPSYFQARLTGGDPEPRVPFTAPPATDGAGNLNVVRWYEAIRNGGAADPSLTDGINAVLPVFAAEIAAEEGRLVRMSELNPKLTKLVVG